MVRKGKLVAWASTLGGTLAIALSIMVAGAGANHNLHALVSTGPTGGNGANDAFFAATTTSGTRAFFETDEKLTGADTDNNYDVYERIGTTTNLISIGPTGGNGSFDVFFAGSSGDGTRVFFETDEKLTSADTDNQRDVYERVGSTTTLLSTGPSGGNGPFFAVFWGASADGSVVIFDTDESLVSADTDSEVDLYRRSGTTTTLLSTGSAGGNGAFSANFDGLSSDGSRVFFNTAEALEPGDSDSSIDLYQRSGSTTTRLSTGPAGGNGAITSFFSGSSADGSRVFLETREVLTSDDTDTVRDVYERSGSTTTRISAGSPGGNGATSAFFDGASEDGSRVIFTTAEQLLANDTDSVDDVYERFSGTTTRVSTGTAGNGAFPANFAWASPDGLRIFFETDESLASGDTDTATDVYERFSGATTRISTGAAGGNGAFPAFFWTGSQDGRRVFFDTDEALASGETDTALDVYAAVTDPQFPRPGGATPLRVPLVPAFKQCTSPNSSHVAPLSNPSCTPPVPESSLLTVSTLGRGLGSVTLSALAGNTSTPADEADVAISASIGDVLNKSAGTEYTGSVIVTTRMRITDRSSGFTGEEGATVAETQFSVPVTCVATPDPAVGGSCNVTTSTDTLLPGFIKETKRTVIATLSVEVLDAGADGSITPGSGACPLSCGSGDEKLFLTQGAFTP